MADQSARRDVADYFAKAQQKLPPRNSYMPADASCHRRAKVTMLRAQARREEQALLFHS